MAIKPTPNNNLFKSLVFDGVNSRDYGIYITGDAVFNSPERDVEMIEIPGRNGAYALDKGRFSNIKVSYPAGIAGDTEADFREGISAFRNALASRKGYKRLEDDYNPGEYRMAVYKSGLEVTPKALKAGEFTITFDCKPQRFLKSGETAVTIGGDVTNPQTKSGSIVSIEGTGADKVTSIVAQIEPVQAGSGDPSPTNVRPITGWAACSVIVSPTTTASDGTTYTVSFGSAGTVYGGTVDVVTGVLKVTHKFYNYGSISTTSGSAVTGGWRCDFPCPSDDVNRGKWSVQTGGQPLLSMFNQKTMNEGGISKGYSANSYTVIIPNATSKAEADAALKNLQIVYKLATPQTYNLTAQQVELLTGKNDVWADTGDITITWGDDPNKLVNPTLYDSHPLLHVWGYGDIGIGGGTLSINNDEYGRTLLANRLSKSATSVSSYLDESAVLMLNSGDDVFVSAGSSVVFPLTFRGSASINITSATIANSSPYDIPMESSVSNFGNYVTVSVSLPQLDFIFNQTLQHLRSNIRVTINYTEAAVSKTSTAECQIHAQYSLTPLGRYRVALFYYDVAVDKFHNPNTAVMTIQPIYGVSTQRPFSDDADFYFDLDIGEAYKIEDGQIISVNNAVTIPAQLPTLKSGANTITYDDTITQFKVVPRWWEV